MSFISQHPPMGHCRIARVLLLLLLLLCSSSVVGSFLSRLCSWRNVTGWSACSSECGHGTQTKVQECKRRWLVASETDPACQACNTQELITRNCSVGIPRMWSPWSAWGPCTTTSLCHGTASRTRLCEGDCGADCVGPTHQDMDCTDTEVMDGWGPWSAWAPCNGTCGDGSTTRSRGCDPACAPCNGTSKERSNCTVGIPSIWSAWQLTTNCSVRVCGEGVMLWNRTCVEGSCGSCHGNNTMATPCAAGELRSWSSWAFGPCSTSCGDDGRRHRTRACVGCRGSCEGPAHETVNCSSGSLREWTAWTATGSCSTDCGVGSVVMGRLCEGCVGTCPGLATQIESCAAGVPLAWEDDGPCKAEGNGSLSHQQSRICKGCWGTACTEGQVEQVTCQALGGRTGTLLSCEAKNLAMLTRTILAGNALFSRCFEFYRHPRVLWRSSVWHHRNNVYCASPGGGDTCRRCHGSAPTSITDPGLEHVVSGEHHRHDYQSNFQLRCAGATRHC